jgi:hypothetical protein
MSRFIIAVGLAVAVSSFGIVRAEHASPDTSKTFACTSGTACVEGNASGNAMDGVDGSSTGSGTHGVYGTGNWAGVAGYTSSTNGGSGVAGISTSASGSANGVYGNSANGPGVYGTSSAADGIMGTTTSTSLAGVYGYSKANGHGVLAEVSDASSEYAVLEAAGDNPATNIFDAFNTPNGGHCFINYDAALSCTGGISGSVLRVRHRSSSGQRVLAYASESASATIEDFGTARAFEGVANVQIDPAFASVIDRKWYYVFLTPLGDTRGLYVSLQTPSAFQVREAENGHSTLSFDYRIVAHPFDAKSDRLPIAPTIKRSPEHLRPSR